MEEIKEEAPKEEKEKKKPSGSPFYRPGTTPSHSAAQSPTPSPPHSPQQSQAPNPSASRKISKDNSSVARKISKDSSSVARKISKEERASIVAEITKVSTPPPVAAIKLQDVPPPKAPKAPEPLAKPARTGNGQLHAAYHSYYVNPVVKLPPPEEPEDEEPEMTQSSLARMPPPPKMVNPKPQPMIRKQESIKPKSLAETKKASIDKADETVAEESVSVLFILTDKCFMDYCWNCYTVFLFTQGPNSILVAMVMLLNIGLAIIFVHFLTWNTTISGKLFYLYTLYFTFQNYKWHNDYWSRFYKKILFQFFYFKI